ncbi:sulfhydryl oxidase 2-like isoform X2 [Clavelina lepadiformis]|uniref:sulfhydryl oxidase 2-like isoform X2 n=1 Tax=Clavelina lepadiformis TaxID=159417 RepID=UPI004041AF49
MKLFCTSTLVFIFFACVICFDVTKNKVAGLKDQKSSSKLFSVYNASGYVINLDGDSFRGLTYNSTNAWFVKFYSRWCGHCKTFASTYSQLADDIKDWQPVVKLGAVDCAGKSSTGKDNGMKLCFTKPFYIGGLPDFRFIPAFNTTHDFGGIRRKFEGKKIFDNAGKVKEDSDSLEKVRESILNFLVDCSKKQFNFLQFMKQKELVKHLKQTDGSHFVLILEKHSSFIGKMIILDMLQYTNVKVRRASIKNKKIGKLLHERFSYIHGDSSHPVALVLSHNNLQLFDDPSNLRHNVTTYLKSMATVKKLFPPAIPQQSVAEDVQKVDIANVLSYDRSKVYMSDLEAALFHSFHKEVGAMKVIEEGDFDHLVEYINVLHKYFPGTEKVMTYLTSLKQSLRSKRKRLNWNQWHQILNASKKIVPLREKYIGCLSTQPGLREFPCALWQLFHVLVGQANGSNQCFQVLQAMRNYITSFFACVECRTHWQDATTDLSVVNNGELCSLYLWRKHNEVNRRLNGSPTEDPYFPKEQWPTHHMCKRCWNETTMNFNVTEVKKFLHLFYSSSNLSFEYMDDEENKTSLHWSPRKSDEL